MMTTETADQTTNGDTSVSPETGNVVFEEPSFDDLKWPPERVYTYAQLYEKLVRQVSHEEAWGRVWRFLLYTFTIFFLWIILSESSPEERWFSIWSFVVFFFLFALVVAVVFIAWLLNQSMDRVAAELAAKLIVVIRSPKTGRQGLYPLDIRRLSRTAAIHQQAADWRGSVVTTLIITLALTGFTALSRYMDQEYFAGVVATQPNETVWQRVMNTVSFIVWLGIPSYVALSLFQYFRRFVSHERANRAILLATADALCSLEECGLGAASSLGIREKRIVIKRLGYQLSPKPLSHSWRMESFSSLSGSASSQEAKWYLEPLTPKTQPYLIEFLVLPLVWLKMYFVLADNIYGKFLRARAKVRRRTTELLAKK